MVHTVTADEAPLLLSPKLVAKSLGISEMQVKHLVDGGQLPSTRIKNRTYIPAESVREYVENIARSA
ncbi:helix-turn-helix domain-containing protein [Nocardioides terrisoli]|uniref:helix-turn-helix domain-containing protein n=1 Tax=Nocardioides terrisoli TaxID=3388267 RepID=UPI00287B5D75|nr:helix-turn-helix domain-containing protein [Nocardioides marmorisolisilvae]